MHTSTLMGQFQMEERMTIIISLRFARIQITVHGRVEPFPIITRQHDNNTKMVIFYSPTSRTTTTNLSCNLSFVSLQGWKLERILQGTVPKYTTSHASMLYYLFSVWETHTFPFTEEWRRMKDGSFFFHQKTAKLMWYALYSVWSKEVQL